MREPITRIRASHVNTGTALDRAELTSPGDGGRVARVPRTHLEVDSRLPMTNFGGLSLLSNLWRLVGAGDVIDQRVKVLKRHNPYHESDHILTLVSNFVVGGSCLEDVSALQHDKAFHRMVGATRLPDPTTEGDFLRRFDPAANPGALKGLRDAVDDILDRCWDRIGKKRPAALRRLGKWGFIDVDSTIVETSGRQREGADFSYTGKFSFHPLLTTLANTGEVLDLVNRPGNVTSAHGLVESLDRVLPQVKRRYGFEHLLLRGDSAFDQEPVRAACERHGVYFATVATEVGPRPRVAAAIPESDWRAYESRTRRRKASRRGYRARQRGADHRSAAATRRGYKRKDKKKIEITEVPYRPSGAQTDCRLVILRETLELRETHGQNVYLFEMFNFRYILTNLPSSASVDEVVDLTYHRCDQENIIEQLSNGIAAMRMPVREFAGNAAFLLLARLAWNLIRAVVALAMEPEVMRWECKRLRRTFFCVAAAVVYRARQTWVRFSTNHLYSGQLRVAHRRILY